MEGDHLLGGAIILVLVALRLVIAVSAFIAYAYRVGVVVLGVATLHGEGTTIVQSSVSRDEEMITWISSEASLGMITLQLLDGVRLRRTCSAAV